MPGDRVGMKKMTGEANEVMKQGKGMLMGVHSNAPASGSTAGRSGEALPQINEHASCLTCIDPPGARPLTASRPFAPVVPFGRAHCGPWDSRAVVELASRVGNHPEATPMLIEGRTGTTLAAIGSVRDHNVATVAISKALDSQLTDKLERAAVYKRELTDRAADERASPQRACPPRKANVSTAAPPASSAALVVRRNSTLASGPSGTGSAIAAGRDDCAVGGRDMCFGAVYEYRDELGRPRYVASTPNQPEDSWSADYAAHATVRTLAHEGGSAHVVWAGVGRGCCGASEMQGERSPRCGLFPHETRPVELPPCAAHLSETTRSNPCSEAPRASL